MHYGFVGRAIGFELPLLLDGAGGAQIASEVLHGNMPRKSAVERKLRSFDNPEDRVSIRLGWDLQLQGSISAAALVKTVVNASGILVRPAIAVREEVARDAAQRTAAAGRGATGR